MIRRTAEEIAEFFGVEASDVRGEYDVVKLKREDDSRVDSSEA